MKLLKNEDKLISSNEDKVVLTNFRIMMRDEVWGKSYEISIFLENISSIEVKYKSNVLFLIIGLVIGAVGLVTSIQVGDSSLFGGLVLAGVFIAIWWFTRKHLVSISSDGGSSLNFVVQGMSDEKIDDFVSKIQEAKLQRINQI